MQKYLKNNMLNQTKNANFYEKISLVNKSVNTKFEQGITR